MEKENRPKTQWKNVFVGRNPDTGKPYFERRKVVIHEAGEVPSIDELPPPGFEPGELTAKLPENIPDITPNQVVVDSKKSRPMTHAAYVAEALEEKEGRENG